MWQDELIARITGGLSHDSDLVALFVGGSIGRGDSDQFSDIDLIAVVPAGKSGPFLERWKELIASLEPVVFQMQFGESEVICNMVTELWHRIDVVVTDQEGIMRRPQDGLKPLIDPSEIYRTLLMTIAWQGPDKGRVTYFINEFIRVFGLLPVALGREEYLLGVMGYGLLRDLLSGLLKEEVERADKGGMLHWKTTYSAEQLAVLESLPVVAPDRASIIAGNLAIATAFFPRARKMAGRLGIEWPEAFEAAAWSHLEREAGVKKPEAYR